MFNYKLCLITIKDIKKPIDSINAYSYKDTLLLSKERTKDSIK